MVKLTLTQDAYVTGGCNEFEEPWYEATAIDEENDNHRYLVKWNILDMDEWEISGDESCACDWDRPASIEDIDGDEKNLNVEEFQIL